MKIGLAYDLKKDVAAGQRADDALEEYDSMETVDAIAAVLEQRGHSVVRLGGGREFLENILQRNVDLVFNIAEGWGNYRSREAQVPCVLEMLGIPYTGADPQCLAVCLDKPLTNRVAASAGIRVPKCQVVNNRDELRDISWDKFPFPVFVKPAQEGSSKGVHACSRIESRSEINDVLAGLLESYQQPIMVEEYISGDEVTVGLLGNRPTEIIGVMRILPRKSVPYFIYSLEVKRDWERQAIYECPAQMPEAQLKNIVEASLKAFKVLGCRDFGRIDFRVNADGPCFLEINPLAGLNPRNSDLPILARMTGCSYEALVSGILDAAMSRYPQCVRK